jgi:ABC-type amino acid transport substrate-binding protein
MSMHFRLRSLRLSAAILALAGASLATQAVAAPSRLDRIRDSRELRVCIWPDYYGVTYRNPKTRLLSGFDIDIANELGQELGVAIRYVDSSFTQLIDKLIDDKCDIAMHAVGITPARQGRLQFTRPYMRSDIYAIASRSSGAIRQWQDIDKPGRVIAVQAGTLMEPVMRQSLKHARLMLVTPPQSREQEVESGRADAFMTDFPYSRRMLDLTDWARLVPPPAPFHPTDYAYAFAPGDASLRNRVDAFLDVMRTDGRLLRFARRHKLDPVILDR